MLAEQEKLTEFSGITGQVLRRSISGGSLITGFVLGGLLLFINLAMAFAGNPTAGTLFSQIVIALALARFALNGRHGQYGGTVFSSAGGGWDEVGLVSLRYLTLCLLWVIPATIFAPGEEQAAAMGPMMNPLMMKGLFTFAAFYFLAATLTPPLFLIVSVSAQNFLDIANPKLWKEAFGGRQADLFMIYAAYTGALIMVAVLSVPFVLLSFVVNWKLAVITGGMALCLLVGVSVNLLGRLCGFFACGQLGLSNTVEEERPKPDAPAVTARPGAPAVPAQAAPPPFKPAAPISVPLSPSAVPQPGAAVAAAPAQATGTLAAGPAQPAAERKPALLDAKQQVDAAMQRFGLDPHGGIAALRELDSTFAPHALVKHALAACLHHAGETEQALEMARVAIPLCLDRGHTQLAAELFQYFRAHAAGLGIEPKKMIVLAGALTSNEEWAAAAKAYSAVIAADSTDASAVKGLLQVADGILHRKANPAAAVKVYRFLMKNCAASPLAETIQQGLMECEQKLGQPAAS